MANNLQHEKSLYLLRHASNPVNWNKWSCHIFEQAKRENKPVFISIGYSACHWCKVMEKESFEDEKTAEFLNKHYISVKIDKDEYPDIDKEYQFYLQSMGEKGGWPLNVFLTPNGEPFYAGTYFPKETSKTLPSFKALIENLYKIYIETPSEIEKVINTRKEFIKNFNTIQTRSVSHDVREKYIKAEFKKIFDPIYFGFRDGAKFPYIPALIYMLDHFDDDQDYKNFLINTADMFCTSGIFDHIFGGFFRYTVDRAWNMPHFEKMLTDNCLMVIFLIRMFEKTGNRLYSFTAQKTIDFILYSDLNTDYGFAESLDADSINFNGSYEEGFYYKVTDRDFSILSNSELKNFPNEAGLTNGVIRLKHKEYIKAAALEPTLQKVAKRIESIKVKPERDNKVISGSNFLLCTALLYHYEVMGEQYDFERAISLYHKLRHLLIYNHDIFHGLYALEEDIQKAVSLSSKENPENEVISDYIINHRVLSDYVYFLETSLKFYELTQEQEFLNISKKTVSKIDKIFKNDNMLYFDINHKVCDTFDDDKINPIGLYLYLIIRYKEELGLSVCSDMLKFAEDRVMRFPTGHPTMIRALELMQKV